MFFEIPLDQGFSGVFTDARSGERTPTGAVRMGLRLDPRRSRGAAESGHGQCSRPPRTGRSGSFGRPAATTGRRPSRETGAGVGSDRADGRLRVASETGACWSVRLGTGQPAAGRGVRRSDRARSTPSGDGRVPHPRVGYTVPPSGALRCSRDGAGNGAVVEEPKELGPPQLDPARSVPIGTRTDGSGNRVSVKRCHGFEAGKPVSSPTRGIARHAVTAGRAM